MGYILGDGYLLVQELRRQLSLLMGSEGRWKYAENLLVRIMNLEGVTNEGQYTFASYLASIYRNQGRSKN